MVNVVADATRVAALEGGREVLVDAACLDRPWLKRRRVDVGCIWYRRSVVC